MRFAACGADVFGELLQRLDMARTPRDADREPFAREGAGDRRPEAVARPDHDADRTRVTGHAFASNSRARGRTQKAISPCAR